jgi:hypothetical protein
MTDAQRYADTIAEEVEELEEGRTDDGLTVGAWDAISEWAQSCVLDLEWTTSSNARTITEVILTRTIGGPGCWITANGDGTVTVRAAWGSDRGRRTVGAPSLDAWAWEMAEVAAASGGAA